jgi:hypothetical protein
MAHPGWREAAAGVRGTPADREAAHQRIGQLLAGLSETLGQLTREETVPASYADALAANPRIEPDTMFRRSRTAILLWTLDQSMSGDRLIVQVEVANDAMNWSAPPRMLPVCAWIADATQFTAGALLERFSDLPDNETLQLLHRLVAAGVLYVR